MSNNHTGHAHDDHAPQTDDMIEGRDRIGALLVNLLTATALAVFPAIIFQAVAHYFRLPISLGTGVGFVISLTAIRWLWYRCFIENGQNIGFVALDPLTTLFAHGNKVYQSYGPGLHICPWYLVRSKEGVVVLSEEAEEFTFSFLATGGKRFIKGSLRGAPDIHDLPRYKASAAVVVKDTVDLLKPKVIEMLKDVSPIESVGMVDRVNTALKAEFVEGKKAIEQRFSYKLSDITITVITLSDEVIKAIEGSSEAEGLSKAVAFALGREDYATVLNLVASGTITQAQYKEALILAMDLSGNASKASIGSQTYTVNVNGLENLSPEVVGAAVAGIKALTTGTAGSVTPAKSKGSKTNRRGSKT